jgi:hypothetical protein
MTTLATSGSAEADFRPSRPISAEDTQAINGELFLSSESFGAETTPSEATHMQYLVNITAPWNIQAKAYEEPWHVHLSAQHWRAGEAGEILMAALPSYPEDKDASHPNA